MKRPYATEWNLKSLDDVISKLKDYITSLEEKLEDRNGKIIPLAVYPNPPSFRLDSDKSYRPSWYPTSPNAARELLGKWLAECKAIREAELPIIENNKKVHAEVAGYLESLGFSRMEYQTEYGRAGKSKRVEKTAGWVSSMYHNIPTMSGFALVEIRYKELMDSIAVFETRKEQAAGEIERKAAEEKRKNQQIITVASLAGKYGLPENSETDDVAEHLFSKNKYLRLAHYLRKNRGDWNEGPSYARTGLESFEATTEEDNDIAESLWKYVNDWDGDGRVFRDCDWNYDRLFNKANEDSPDLVADYEKLVAIFDDL